jgi:hypothetical protein
MLVISLIHRVYACFYNSAKIFGQYTIWIPELCIMFQLHS